MMDDAVAVGGEALDRGAYLHIALLALQREAQIVDEGRDRLAIVGAGDTDMVEAGDHRTGRCGHRRSAGSRGGKEWGWRCRFRGVAVAEKKTDTITKHNKD